MAILTLGQGDQTYVFTRANGPVDDVITDFGSIYFDIAADGSQVRPTARVTDATATGTMRLNKGQDSLAIDITITGIDLDGNQTVDTGDNIDGINIHRGAAGVNGPTVWGIIGPDTDTDNDTVINAATGQVTSDWDGTEGNGPSINLGTEINRLLTDALYLHVETVEFPNGEIRSQLVKQDNGADKIDVTALNIGSFASVQYLIQEFADLTGGTNAGLFSVFNGVSFIVEFDDVTIADISAADFVFQTAIVNETIVGSVGDDDLFGAGGDDIVNGGGGIDFLFGEDGNDTLNGGAGDDTMFGGAGNDRYVVDDPFDVVVEGVNQGSDLVQSNNVDLDLANYANVENLTLLGSLGLAATGNNGVNNLIGNSGANILSGNGGNDVIRGNGGSDTIFGGLGRDVLTGGTEADAFVYLDVAESVGALADRIMDFLPGDFFDVSNIDADGDAGNGHTSFIVDALGDVSFAKGHIRQVVQNGNLLVDFNVDDDRTAEMRIILFNYAGTISQGDFIT